MASDAERIDHAVARVEEIANSGCPRPPQEQIDEAFRLLCRRLEQVLDPIRPPRLNLSPRAWSAALLAQARQDLDAARRLSEHGHRGAATMLLQMTFEKLAKAALARRDGQEFRARRRSHAVALRFLQAVAGEVGTAWSHAITLAKAVSAAHPALARDGPHLEYPWEGEERLLLPDDDLLIVRQLFESESRGAAYVAKFAEHLLQRFDKLF